MATITTSSHVMRPCAASDPATTIASPEGSGTPSAPRKSVSASAGYPYTRTAETRSSLHPVDRRVASPLSGAAETGATSAIARGTRKR
jgi:hypothetical protein